MAIKASFLGSSNIQDGNCAGDAKGWILTWSQLSRWRDVTVTQCLPGIDDSIGKRMDKLTPTIKVFCEG